MKKTTLNSETHRHKRKKINLLKLPKVPVDSEELIQFKSSVQKPSISESLLPLGEYSYSQKWSKKITLENFEKILYVGQILKNFRLEYICEALQSFLFEK